MRKVSVIIPAYNKADLTVETVESVLSQTYRNIETIVVDDGSTDDTRIKLAPFGEKITYVHKPNGGACSARNVGIKRATGDYIALIDCDDIYYPEKIARSVACLEEQTDCGLVYTAAYFIDRKGDIISEHGSASFHPSGWIAPQLILKNFICNSTVVMKRECFDKVGYFDESIFIPADWDMLLRLSEAYRVAYVDDKLSGYRLTDSYTAANMEKGIREIIYVLDKAVERNKSIPSGSIRRCLATVYLSCGIDYAVRQEFRRSRQTLLRAFLRRPYSPSVLCVLGALLVSPKWARKAILRLRPNKSYLVSA